MSDWHQDWHDLMTPGHAKDFFTAVSMPPFQPVMDKFDHGVALWLCEFSRLIYRQEASEGTANVQPIRRSEVLNAGDHGWAEADGHFFNGLEPGESRRRRFWRPAVPVEDTQAALLTNEKLGCSVLVFRGTLGPLDLLTDLALLAWPLRFKGKGSAHHGFSGALDTVWDRIRPHLLRAPGRVFLTGHSLGGALATLAACRMIGDDALRDKVAALYTFGSPRVGTKGFENNFDNLFHARIVHDEDLVPRVPPAFSVPPFPRYKHVGLLHTVREGQAVTPATKPNEDLGSQIEGISETRRLLRSLIKGIDQLRPLSPPKPLRDHTPLLYTRALAASVHRSTTDPLSLPVPKP